MLHDELESELQIIRPNVTLVQVSTMPLSRKLLVRIYGVLSGKHPFLRCRKCEIRNYNLSSPLI